MRRVFLAAAFALSVLAASAIEARACLCEAMPARAKIRKLRRTSDAIFIGTVVKTSKEMDAEGFLVLKMVYRAEQIWKSDDSSSMEFVVYSNVGCRAWFFEGARVLVYAKRNEEGKLHTTVCMRTGAVENSKEDLKYLGEPRTVITYRTSRKARVTTDAGGGT
jgi:hypothetical protein